MGGGLATCCGSPCRIFEEVYATSVRSGTHPDTARPIRLGRALPPPPASPVGGEVSRGHPGVCRLGGQSASTWSGAAYSSDPAGASAEEGLPPLPTLPAAV